MNTSVGSHRTRLQRHQSLVQTVPPEPPKPIHIVRDEEYRGGYAFLKEHRISLGVVVQITVVEREYNLRSMRPMWRSQGSLETAKLESLLQVCDLTRQATACGVMEVENNGPAAN
jgi:hypothetical protein